MAILPIATVFHSGMRRVRRVAIHHAVAMIHGADESLRPTLLAFAPATAVAGVVHSPVRAAIATVTILGREAILAGGLGLSHLLGWMGLAGPCSRLGVGLAFCLVVGVSLTSAAPATMPLPFTLPSRLSLIRWLGFWLVFCCHACTSRCVGCSCSLLRSRPSLDRGRQRLAATHVSTWPMATGHVPRSQEELIQDTVWGGTYGLISQTKYWCWSIPQFNWPSDEHRYLGQQVRRGRKPLLTLENCGELDSHLGSGFSRSIGKTDNTQIPRPRASAIRRARFQKFELEVSEVRSGVQNRDTKAGSRRRK